jgi:hypothetical protein
MATPLQTVKSEFGTKEALVDKLVPLLDRQSEESEASFRDRLLHVSNTKLLRLWEREQALRSKFGSREALVDAIVQLRAGGQKPDADYRRRILAFPTGRLLTMHSGLAKRAKAAG